MARYEGMASLSIALHMLSELQYDEFDVLVTTSCISRALAYAGWSKKVARRVASERNADLRDFYLHKRAAFRSYHMVYIDELSNKKATLDM